MPSFTPSPVLNIPVLQPQPPTGDDDEDEEEQPQGHEAYLYEVDEEEAAFAQSNDQWSPAASENDADSEASEGISVGSSDLDHHDDDTRGPNMLFDEEVSAYTDDFANLDLTGLSSQLVCI